MLALLPVEIEHSNIMLVVKFPLVELKIGSIYIDGLTLISSAVGCLYWSKTQLKIFLAYKKSKKENNLVLNEKRYIFLTSF